MTLPSEIKHTLWDRFRPCEASSVRDSKARIWECDGWTCELPFWWRELCLVRTNRQRQELWLVPSKSKSSLAICQWKLLVSKDFYGKDGSGLPAWPLAIRILHCQNFSSSMLCPNYNFLRNFSFPWMSTGRRGNVTKRSSSKSDPFPLQES